MILYIVYFHWYWHTRTQTQMRTHRRTRAYIWSKYAHVRYEVICSQVSRMYVPAVDLCFKIFINDIKHYRNFARAIYVVQPESLKESTWPLSGMLFARLVYLSV